MFRYEFSIKLEEPKIAVSVPSEKAFRLRKGPQTVAILRIVVWIME